MPSDKKQYKPTDDTVGSTHFDAPEVIDLMNVSGQCEWGNCDEETVALRWEGGQVGQYLAVCAEHRASVFDIA